MVTKVFDVPMEITGWNHVSSRQSRTLLSRGHRLVTLRFSSYYGMDTMADILGSTKSYRIRPLLEGKSAQRSVANAVPVEDGRMYKDDEFTRYPGREQIVFWMMSDALMLQWLADRKMISRKRKLAFW